VGSRKYSGGGPDMFW
jgi:hypothetical protein